MDEQYQIVYVEKPEQAAWGIIGRGLHGYNVAQVGDGSSKRLCYVVQNGDGEILGGVLGEVHWGWFYLDLIWLPEEIRGQGYGHQLLVQVETAAREAGAKQVYLDTFSFQALDFYTSHGYEIFGELKDFPPGHQRYYMTKKL